jgi:exopolysaccharide biosynthesis protein
MSYTNKLLKSSITASFYLSAEISTILISNGACVNAKSPDQSMTALHYVALNVSSKLNAYKEQLSQLLISHGANVNAKS